MTTNNQSDNSRNEGGTTMADRASDLPRESVTCRPTAEQRLLSGPSRRVPGEALDGQDDARPRRALDVPGFLALIRLLGNLSGAPER